MVSRPIWFYLILFAYFAFILGWNIQKRHLTGAAPPRAMMEPIASPRWAPAPMAPMPPMAREPPLTRCICRRADARPAQIPSGKATIYKGFWYYWVSHIIHFLFYPHHSCVFNPEMDQRSQVGFAGFYEHFNHCNGIERHLLCAWADPGWNYLDRLT